MKKIYKITDKIIDYYNDHCKCAALIAIAAGAGLVVGYLIGG